MLAPRNFPNHCQTPSSLGSKSQHAVFGESDITSLDADRNREYYSIRGDGRDAAIVALSPAGHDTIWRWLFAATILLVSAGIFVKLREYIPPTFSTVTLLLAASITWWLWLVPTAISAGLLFAVAYISLQQLRSAERIYRPSE